MRAAKRLVRKRRRSESGLILVEGRNVIVTALEAGVEFESLFVTDPNDPLASWVDACVLVSEQLLGEITTTVCPQGIVAVAKWRPSRELARVERTLIVLDGVSDPGNVGTLIRSAAAFGADAVLVGSGTCDPTNPKVVRASAGAVFQIPVVVASDFGWIDSLRRDQVDIAATAADGQDDPRRMAESERIAIVVGAEAHGVHDAVAEAATLSVRIPLSGAVDSINAAVAGSLLLYERSRELD